jgi:hypothetical protein
VGDTAAETARQRRQPRPGSAASQRPRRVSRRSGHESRREFLTVHGAHRIGQRVGLPKRAILRFVQRALAQGLERQSTKGRLRRYLDKFYYAHAESAEMRVYGQFVFVFAGSKLITTWGLPAEYQRLARA